MGELIISVGFVAAIAYLPLQIYTVAKWRGAWRLTACLPILGMVPIIVITFLALLQNSNLWPLLLIFASPVAALYLFAVLALKAMLRGSDGDTQG